jgi:YhcH/YjgK/YiaL family protein
MIHDSLANCQVYRPLHPRIAAALEFLSKFDPRTEDGRVPIDGDDLYAMVQSYVPTPPETRAYESHRLYVDVQFVASGSEIVFWAPLDRLQATKAYSAEHDAALYSGSDLDPIHLRTGDFAVLFPQDGHKPGCLWMDRTPVKKVVVKARIWPS